MTLDRDYSKLLMVLACVHLPLLAQTRIEHTTDIYPGGNEHPSWLVARVVDDITGTPIANADVFLVREADTPVAGQFWYTRKVKSDANGWMRAPIGDIKDKWHMQVLRHPQYGVAARVGSGDTIWRVSRPFDVPVRIVDWRGDPVSGANIGFCGGCGHTPDLQNATTDANGIAVLTQIDPHSDIGDVYVQHEGLGLGYDSIRWNPGETPEVVECRWAPAMTGILVDHRDQPIANAFVGTTSVHRGPWTRTAQDGSFRLLGAPASSEPSQVCLPNGRRLWFESAKQFPAKLTVPEEGREGTITQPSTPPTTKATRKVLIRLVGDDSLMAKADWPSAPASRSSDDEELLIPTTGPFVVSVYATNGPKGRPYTRKHFFADASQLPPEPVELAYFEPLEVGGRVIDDHGLPAAAQVYLRADWSEREAPELLAEGIQPTFKIQTHLTGRTLLEVIPTNKALRPRLLWIVLPGRGTKKRLDVQDVVLSKAPQLQVLDSEGRPLTGVEVEWARPGYQGAGHTHSFELDDQGGWLGPDLRAGDALILRANDEVVPYRTILAGPSPWTIRAPDGALELKLVDTEGNPLTATCIIGDHDHFLRPGAPLLGLSHGEMTCHLSVPGYQSAVVRTVINATPKKVTVVMRRL